MRTVLRLIGGVCVLALAGGDWLLLGWRFGLATAFLALVLGMCAWSEGWTDGWQQGRGIGRSGL